MSSTRNIRALITRIGFGDLLFYKFHEVPYGIVLLTVQSSI